MRKEGESNPQGSSLGRFRDGCHRRLACPSSTRPSSRSTGGRNRTCGLLLNREAHGPAHASPVSVGSGPECPAGVGPARPPRRGGRLPPRHGHAKFDRSMGPGGLEPPPPGLKGRCAAVTPRPRASAIAGRAFDPIHGFLPPVGTAGFEPAISRSQGGRITRLSHIPDDAPTMTREGVEPCLAAVKGRCPADRRTGRPAERRPDGGPPRAFVRPSSSSPHARQTRAEWAKFARIPGCLAGSARQAVSARTAFRKIRRPSPSRSRP